MQNAKCKINKLYIYISTNERKKKVKNEKKFGKFFTFRDIYWPECIFERMDDMNSYDPQKAARVWQRVQSARQEPVRPDENLKELIMNEWIAAATYARLSRQLPQAQGQVLQRLSREEHGHGACLRGIYALKTGEKCPVHTPEPGTEPVEATLRRCYGLEMRSLKEYEAKTGDPEYGHVYARLADQEREHCMALLGVIGGLGKK